MLMQRLRGLFGRRPGTVELLEQGELVCSGCGRRLALAGRQPLTLSPCEHCDEPNFVPGRLPGYWLCRPLGGGGMGSVYLARPEAGGAERYAAKVVRPGAASPERLAESLQREIEVMQHIQPHPCLLTAVDAGEDEHGAPYLITPYQEGERLDVRFSRLGHLSEQEVILVGLRLLGGLTHLYNAGFLYRDLKTQTIVMGADGACLLDFGICLRLAEARDGSTAHVEGSSLYYPPERLSGQGEGRHSEIYSLGMVMYHALTGSPYFTAKDIETMTTLNVRKRRLLERRRPTDDSIRPDLSRVIEKMIKRQGEERYQTFLDAEHDLLQTLTHRH